ncbi:MAG TPA: hypothetical protein VED41_05635, partial [Solirubrobacteraceae bacterium]|nr:hypothetical protein [Solirubrobacteraceae bacterium]
MCGIAGLYTKSPALRAELGEHLAAMLEQLSFRGPDSAGVAFYRDPAPPGSCKVSLCAAAGADWGALGEELACAFGEVSPPSVRASHATFTVAAAAEDVQAWLAEHHGELRLMSAGTAIEIYKEAGPP